MERLTFGERSRYSAIEAAIHTARYAIALPFSKGRRVLDIACGEGYGSYLLAERWGAQSVLGVDISEEAITSARKNFVAERLTFLCAEAGDPSWVTEDLRFDLIVSLETIEHLRDPLGFLKQIRSISAPDATIIISCPNDHYYYPSKAISNKFHERKYFAEEFFGLVESVLGPTQARFMGLPLSGFVNVAEGVIQSAEDSLAIADIVDFDAAVSVVPSDTSAGWDNCSYFLGIWQLGRARSFALQSTAVVHAEPMRAPAIFEPALDVTARAVSVANRALLDELKLAREQIDRLWADNDELRLQLNNVPWRIVASYRRMRRFIPMPLLLAAGRLFDRIMHRR